MVPVPPRDRRTRRGTWTSLPPESSQPMHRHNDRPPYDRDDRAAQLSGSTKNAPWRCSRTHRRDGLVRERLGLHPRRLMVAWAKAHGIAQVGFSTNGFFLTPELGEQLIRAGLDRLECSVDGVDPASYLQLRRSKEFGRVVANLQGFLQIRNGLGSERPVVTIQFMKTPQTEAFLPQARDFWAPLLKPRDFLMTIEDISFAGGMRPRRYYSERSPCKWLWNYAVVLWNGDVVTCVSDYDGTRVMGNVRERSLTAIWQSAGYQELRRTHLERRFGESGICAGCDDWALADGHGYQNVKGEKA